MVDKNQANKSHASTEVEKYVTEMKELPTYQEERKTVSKPKVAKTKVVSESGKPKSIVKKEEPKDPKSNIIDNDEVSEDKSDRLITTKDVLLGIINIASLALLVVLLIKLPEKAQELKKLRNQVLLSESEVQLELSEIEKYQGKADELEDFFVDEVGLVNFVSDVEGLKGDASSISKINITSQKVIQDGTRNYGIPVIIEMRGNWIQFGEDIQKIQKLPYIFRAVRIDVEELEEGGVIGLKYGGFLYANDKLGED